MAKDAYHKEKLARLVESKRLERAKVATAVVESACEIMKSNPGMTWSDAEAEAKALFKGYGWSGND